MSTALAPVDRSKAGARDLSSKSPLAEGFCVSIVPLEEGNPETLWRLRVWIQGSLMLDEDHHDHPKAAVFRVGQFILDGTLGEAARKAGRELISETVSSVLGNLGGFSNPPGPEKG